MLKKLLLLFFVFISYLNPCLEAVETKKYEFEFPKKKTKLVIPVPEGFKVANYGPISENIVIAEHIPEQDSLENWSEMMTMHFSKQAINPFNFMTITKQSFEKSDPKGKSQISKKTESGIRVVYGMFQHICVLSFPGAPKTSDHELVGVKIIQIANESYILQYAVRYDPKNTTEVQKQNIENKINAYLKSCEIISLK